MSSEPRSSEPRSSEPRSSEPRGGSLGREAREPDRALVRRCRDGDEGAWSEVYRTHGPAVRRYLEGALGRREDGEDLVQAVFLTFFRTAERFAHRCSLRSWLLAIAVRHARNAHRGDRRRQRGLAALAAAMRSLVERGAPGVEVRAQSRRDLIAVTDALASMREAHREAWVLRELVGLTPEEAAAALSVRPATLRSWHHRARQQLIAVLDGASEEASASASCEVTAPAGAGAPLGRGGA